MSSEPKKRGRRKKILTSEDVESTKGKKNVIKTDLFSQKEVKKNLNIIIHLKCSNAEIDQYISKEKIRTNTLIYDPSVPKEIVPFESEEFTKFQTTENINESIKPAYSEIGNIYCPQKQQPQESEPYEEYKKIKELKLKYYKNDIPDKKVDCFWCTFPYDNDPFFVLQNGSNGDVLAHGSFCSAQCAVAFLFQNMNWDDSAKMESYQLMNHFYAEDKTQVKSIKPAMSPYYFLDKYYGNLTIQEYRRLLKTSQVMLCLQKPVTRILPEIQEDNDESFLDGKTQLNRGNYKVKKQSEKVNTKNRNEILRNNFMGITTVN